MKNLCRNAGLRLLPLIAVLGLGAASASAHAVTLSQIKITSGSDVYTCNLSNFTVSAGVVSTTVAGCSPALGGGGNENPGGGNENPGGGNENPGGGNENPGGSVGGSDPRNGTWSPDLDATPRVIVVNQSGVEGNTQTVVPGCVNGGSIENGSWCSTQSEYSTTVGGESVSVRLTKDQILSVRYPVAGATKTGSTGTLVLANAVGGNIGVNTKVSLSPVPGDMTGNNDARCVHTTTMRPTIATGTKAASCVIDRSKSMYYLNIEVQQACSGSGCIFYISEGSSEFK